MMAKLCAKITLRLAQAYLRNPAAVASICDEQLDKSGNLLGWLREAAQKLEPTHDR